MVSDVCAPSFDGNVARQLLQVAEFGGCRMGADPGTSVVDGWGRAHDHENLFIVGAPTCVTMSCANATLTFCALALRAADEMARG